MKCDSLKKGVGFFVYSSEDLDTTFDQAETRHSQDPECPLSKMNSRALNSSDTA
jgi:hypothetical protein